MADTLMAIRIWYFFDSRDNFLVLVVVIMYLNQSFMARQHGLVMFTGRIGGLSFYKMGSGYFVKMAGGPSRERIMHDASFERTREGNREFAGAAKAGKALRMGFAGVLKGMRDRYLTPRLTQAFLRLCALGDGVRGAREISISRFGALLDDLAFDTEKPFDAVFRVPLKVKHDMGRSKVWIDVTAFSPKRVMRLPKGASHFRLVLAAAAVSDYVYDVDAPGYVPLSPNFNGLGAHACSDLLALDGTSLSGFLLETVFSGVPDFPSEVGVVVAVGIEFFQRVDGVDCLLEEGRCMKVLGVV